MINFIRILHILCIFLRALHQTAAQNCEEQSLFKVLISKPGDVAFYKIINERPDTYNVTIDREVRSQDKILMFRTSTCSQRHIKNLLDQYNVKDFEIEPYSEFSLTLNLESFNDDEITENFFDSFEFDVVTRRYLTSAEITIYVKRIVDLFQTRFPKLETNLKLEGKSYEGRPIHSVSIGYKGRNNPIVFIDAGIHAREWHSRSLALYILHQLINEAELGEEGLFSTVSFIIVPDANPDGYEYSRNRDNMWRKTRRPTEGKCIGVDGNRNFNVKWHMGFFETRPCHEVYKGEKPFSEVEAQIIRDIMFRIKDHSFLYLTIHTYGNTIIYPYGYTKTPHTKQKYLHQIATAGVNAVRHRTGTIFTADQSGTQLYIAAGGSDDYAMDVAKIPYALTLELGPERYSFIVPIKVLHKTVFDGWIVTKAMIEEARKLYDLQH